MKRRLITVSLLSLCSLVLPASRALAQGSGRVTGTVTSAATNGPITGVRVTVLGTQTTVTTNPQGTYSLTLAPGTYRLRASAIGYTPVVMDSVPVTAGGASTANFTLAHQTVQLEQVVVIGYGTQEKRDVTGAVGSVAAEQIKQVPTTNAIEAIKGRVAGVDIVSTGYKPGDGVQVRIRGQRSLRASNDPLYVLDGVPMAGSIGDLNPGDIESIEVLKDASATAIYGSRGANGVVLVTSKQGRAGQTRLTYDTYVSQQDAKDLDKVRVFNAAEFVEYKRQASITTGAYGCPAQCAAGDLKIFLAPELEGIKNGVDTDWISLITRKGSQISHQMGVNGGNDRAQFAASGNLVRQIGVILSQNFDRKSMRVNVETQAGTRLRLGGSALLLRSMQNLGRGDGLFDEAMQNNPLGAPFDSAGNVIFKPIPDAQRDNPLSDVANWIDEVHRTRAFGTMFATLNIAPGLDYRANFGPDISFRRRGIFRGAQTQVLQGAGADGSIEEDRILDYTIDNLLTYKRDLGTAHRVDATLLYSIEKNRLEENFQRASGLPYESQRFYNLGTGSTIESISSNLAEWALKSYMARVNYTLLDKYLLTLTTRIDGSSRLAEGKKYATFPSVALGYRAMDDNGGDGLLNSLKLRASYGKTGNTGVNPYQTQGGLTRTAYSYGPGAAFGYRPGTLPNPDLQWEKTAQLDAGVDFGMFNSRLTGTVDVYQANTTDLLMDRQLPPTTGYSSVLQNIGETKNTGLEVALSHVTLDGWRGVRWNNDITYTRNKNEIVSLYGGTTDDVGNRWFIGQPINQPNSSNRVWYDYRMTGIWQEADAALAKSYARTPGQIRLEDINGDGKINDFDRVILGNSYPKWSGSFSSRVEYKALDLSFQAITRQGFMVYNGFRTDRTSLAGRYNVVAVNYWTPQNPGGTDPRPNVSSEFPVDGGTRGYEDGSFTKIRNITLGVAVPTQFARRAKVESLRIYGTAQDPFTFTSFRGLDPEGRTGSGSPSYSSLLIGASVGF